MTDPKDLDAIDEGWGDEPEPAPAPPVPKPVPKVPLKRLGKPAPPAGETPPDDDIEFEADAVARDSMPTFQHPNPLQFDQPDPPRVPKPPPLPKFRKK